MKRAGPTPERTGTKRILHVVQSLDPGGLENGVVNVANRLDRAAFEVGIVGLVRLGAYAARLRADVERWSLGKTPGKSPLTLARLAGLVRCWRPDVVHTHNLGPLLYGTGATLWGCRGRVFHGEHAELVGRELGPVQLCMRRVLCRRAALVHAVSSSLGRQLELLGCAAGGVRVIRNGVDTDRYRPGDAWEARHALGLPKGVRVAGMVGRFGRFKRQADLIRAFELVAGGSPGWVLLLVGAAGPEEDRVRQMAADSRVARRIVLTGFLADPLPAYRAMDVLVVPSTNEGLSNAILEGMACGIPVLTHAACGASEAIEDGIQGWIEDLGDVPRLAAALRRIMAAGLTGTMGQNARQRVVSAFGIDRMVSAYETAYRQIAGLGGGR